MFYSHSSPNNFFLSIYYVLFEDPSRTEGFFDRTLLYGYELPSFFPPQTLTIIFYERDTLSMIVMITIFYFKIPQYLFLTNFTNSLVFMPKANKTNLLGGTSIISR